MSSFHDDEVWQAAYLASLDVLDACEGDTTAVLGHVKTHALTILTVTADALSRTDGRERDEKLRNVLGLSYALRSLLSVAWAQTIMDDETFKGLDETYEALSQKISASVRDRSGGGSNGRNRSGRQRRRK